jgi:ribosomal protein L35AE/L33A
LSRFKSAKYFKNFGFFRNENTGELIITKNQYIAPKESFAAYSTNRINYGYKKEVRRIRGKVASIHLEISCIDLEYASHLIEVGALTIGKDETGKIIVQNTYFPMQFSKNGIKTILTLTFKDCNSQIIAAKVYGRQDWY